MSMMLMTRHRDGALSTARPSEKHHPEPGQVLEFVQNDRGAGVTDRWVTMASTLIWENSIWPRVFHAPKVIQEVEGYVTTLLTTTQTVLMLLEHIIPIVVCQYLAGSELIAVAEFFRIDFGYLIPQLLMCGPSLLVLQIKRVTITLQICLYYQ